MKCFKCKQIIESEAIYGLHLNCFKEWFKLPITLEFSELDPKTSSAKPGDLEITKNKDTFFHGRYLKYSAQLSTTSYILKIQEDKFPELPALEYLCNEIATILDIEVPPYYLIHFNDRVTFVTRNFMQDYTGALHHIYKFLPKGAQHYNCQSIIKTILEETGKLAEVVKFIEICLFDALIGNNDRHGRNLGIIETANTKKLAPMYDNPSFLGIEEDFMLEAHFGPSGSIWTQKSKEPKTLDYIEEFKDLGHTAIVSQFHHKIISKAPKIFEAILQAEISQKRKEALARFLKARIEDFDNAK